MAAKQSTRQSEQYTTRARIAMLALLFGFVGLIMLMSTSATKNANLSLVTSKTAIGQGEEFSVDLRLDTAGDGISALETAIVYDPIAVEFIDFSPIDKSAWNVTQDSVEKGRISIVRGATAEGVKEPSITVVTARFRGLSASITSSMNIEESVIVGAVEKENIFGSSKNLAITVDNAAPSVSVARPFSNSLVSGSSQFALNVDDNHEVQRVDVHINGVQVRSLTGSPYTFEYDTRTLPDGEHVISATAYDQVGNESSTAGIPFIVDNTAPVIVAMSPAPNALVAGIATIRADIQDSSAIERVTYFINDEEVGIVEEVPYEVEWDSTTVVDGSVELRAEVVDALGNVTQSSVASITVANAEQVRVEIITPAPNDEVSGNVNVAVLVSGATAVDYVALLEDEKVVATDESFPYAFVWDSTFVENGAPVNLVAQVSIGDQVFVSPSVTLSAQNAISSDINEDGTVDLVDFTELITNLGETSDVGRNDVNRDGEVNIFDLSRLLNQLN